MKNSWLIVLAPKASVQGGEDFETLPAFPAETVAGALEPCPFLRRSGLSFESALLGPFELSPDGVRFLSLEDVADLPTLAAIAEGLARGVGPVTILGEDQGVCVEVKGGMAAEEIEAALGDSAETTTESSGPLRDLRPSLNPPAFAPGRPEKRILPPLKRVLIVTAILGVLGVPSALHRGTRELLGCGGESSTMNVTMDPKLADTKAAMMYAHLFLTGGQGCPPTPEGWLEVPGTGSPTSYLIFTAADGRRLVCDAWRNPIRCNRVGSMLRYTSFGPNGRDDRGRGDDIVESYPAR